MAEGNNNKKPIHGTTNITEPGIELPKPKKLKLYIVLPSSSKESQGDVILQAAGFLAARDRFGKSLDIEFFNHENDYTKAQTIIQDIINAQKGMPICAIFTMSRVSHHVRGKVETLIGDDNSIKDRLSIIFTVSSALETPSDRKNYFQHFITGKSEAKEIIKHCMTIKDENRLDKPTVYLLGMDSPYSTETIEYLRVKFSLGFVCEEGVINKEKKIPWEFINKIKQESNMDSFCIVIAYDMYLFEALKSLSKIGYEGHVISTTTLSVGDWQEYLKKDTEFQKSYLNLKFVKIEGFGKNSTTGFDNFKGDLKRWTFEEVIAEKELYPEGPAIAKKSFSKLEQEVYNVIWPNYISAFCYDSVRLFSLLTSLEKTTLKQIYDEKHEHEIIKHSPFADNIDITNLGQVKVDLYVKNFSFKDIDKDVLIVVNMQNDFCANNVFEIPDIESLFPSLTDTIEKASKAGMMIIFKQDWHPKNHYSFEENGGQWPTHCVEKTPGAVVCIEPSVLLNSLTVRTGCKKNKAGYSPYENPKMDVLIDRCNRKIFVTGVALEYGVKETCLESIKKGKEVVAIKPLIRSIGKDKEATNRTWELLSESKVEIRNEIPDLSTQPAV